MKTSIKIGVIALLTLIFFFNLQVKAQTTGKTESYGSGIRLSVGADAGIPLGSLKNNYEWNLGGSLQGDFPILKDQLYATLNSGYNNFFNKNDSPLSNLHLIPVKAGLKYFLVRSVYIQGEAGAAFVTDKNTLGTDKSAAFVYAPQAGVLFNLGGRNYIDAGVRFEGTSKLYTGGGANDFLGLRVAYEFGL